MREETVKPALGLATMHPTRNKTLIDYVLLTILLVNVAALILYICLSYKFVFHSDSAAANLLAQEIYETGNYFPTDWNYVNGDLWVLFVHTWLLPFLPFMPNGYALHAMGGIISAALVLAGTWWVCRTMALSPRARLAALALVASGFSPNMSENLYGQAAYGMIYYFGCFIFCASHAFLYARGRKTGYWAIAVFALLLLVAWSNPLRAAIYYVLPVGAAAAWCHMVGIRLPAASARSYPARLGMLLLVVVGACFAGALLHADFLARSHSASTGVSINWLTFDGMGRNAAAALQGSLSLLSGLPPAGMPVAELRGALDAMRLVAGGVLLVASVWALLRSLGTTHPGRLFIGVATLAAFSSNLFIFLTTTLPFTNDPEASIRYLAPALLCMLLLLVGVVVDDRNARWGGRRISAVAIAAIAFTAPHAYELAKVTEHASLKEMNDANPRVRLTNFLIDNNLRYGYATFWNAGVTTVLAKNVVRVRNIELANGLPHPMHHLSSDRWYQPSAWNGPSFLLLGKNEAGAVKWQEFKRLAGEPSRTLTFEDYQIIVFDHNIARDFADWSVRVEQPMIYPALATSAHEVGVYDPAAGGLVAPSGTSGALHFGPYQRLEGGHYLVSFDITAEGAAAADFGRVEVVAESGKRVFAMQPVTTAGSQRIALPVTFDRLVRDLEFRVITTGAGKFTLRNIELTRAQQDRDLTSKVK